MIKIFSRITTFFLFPQIILCAVKLTTKTELEAYNHSNSNNNDSIYLSKMLALSDQERSRREEKIRRGKLRLQGVAVRGRLVCGENILNGTKVKLVDLDKRPDRDDLMAETITTEDGYFQMFGATKEEGEIEAIIKIYHDCLDEHVDCQRKVTWQIPSEYYNNGTIEKWFDIGTVNMELIFQSEERDCRH